MASHSTRRVYYLSAGPPRIQPVGGGRAIIDRLADAAAKAGIKLRYESPGTRLKMGEGGVSGVEVRSSGRPVTALDADAVILASGGFQGDVTMMRKHFGPAAETLKLISPGTRFETGDGIRMAIDQGASVSGDWNGMHIEPIDPRSPHSAPVVLVYPYGIVVDQDGRRFFDEGGGLVHETWEAFARDIHFARPNSIAYAILDSRLFDITGFERAITIGRAAHRAETIEDLAMLIGVPARNLKATVDAYNAAATGDASHIRCDALRRTGGGSRAAAAEIELGARHRQAALPRLSAGRRHRLHVRRTCHQRQGRSAGRARTDAGSLRGGRDYRAFLRHRAERGCGVAGAGVRKDRRPAGGRFPGKSDRAVGKIGRTKMASENNGAFIRNIAEVPWREFPNHFGGALSKPLVMPETAGSRHIDYRISMYQPMAHVARHKHRVQEQIYHVLEGEGLMEIAGKNHVVRKHDFIFLPPGVEHAISNSGLVDWCFWSSPRR